MKRKHLSRLIMLAIALMQSAPAFADQPQAGFRGSNSSSLDADLTTLGGFPDGSAGAQNKLVGTDAAGTAYELKTPTGTANQVNVAHGVGTVTFSTPQDIHTGATPTFAGSILSAALRPSAAAGTTVGTLLLPFSSIYIGGAATNNIQITGTATGSRVATFPDATITVAGINNANNWSVAQLPSAFGTIDLGSITRPFKDFYIANGGSNYTLFRSGVLTGNRTVTFPDGDSNTVRPDTGAANNFLTAIASTGVISKAQPAFSNLSGAISVAQGSASGAAANRVLGIDNAGTGTEYKAITAGTNISVVHGANSITINNTASSGLAFGGSGAAGAIDPAGSVNFNSFTTSSSATQGTILQATTFQLDTAKTLTIDTAPEVQIFTTSTFDITGTITYTAAGGIGGAAAASNAVYRGSDGGGPGGGRSGSAGIGTSGSAGGGGSFGGLGGFGGGAATARVTPVAPTYWWSHEGGSGGASGVDGGGTGSAFTAGARGGSAFVVNAAGNVTINSGAIITCNAAAAPGAPTTAGGGSGGGSGGGVLIASQGSITFSAGATINVLGSNGGNGTGTAGGGGAGGGGRAIFWADTVTNSGTVTATTATGGTATYNGGNGGAPVVTVVDGVPNIPLLTWSIDTPEGQSSFLALEQVHKIRDQIAGISTELKDGYVHHFPQREIAYAAAGNDIAMYSSYMNPSGEASVTCDAEVSEAIANMI